MKSKGSSFDSMVLPNSDFLFLILVLIWSIIEWIMGRLSVSLGSIAFSICLKRARELKRPSVEIVEVKAELIIFPLVTCLCKNLPIELVCFIPAHIFFPKRMPQPPERTRLQHSKRHKVEMTRFIIELEV